MLRGDLIEVFSAYSYQETTAAGEYLALRQDELLNKKEELKVWGLLSDCLDHHRGRHLDPLRHIERALAARATLRVLPLDD